MLSGVTPVYGIGLREKDYPDTMVAVGPLCRKTEDLIPFMKVLVGPNASKLKLDVPVNVKNLRVFYQENSGDLRASKMSGTMRAALLKAVNHFKELTGSAQKVRVYKFRYLILQNKNYLYVLVLCLNFHSETKHKTVYIFFLNL